MQESRVLVSECGIAEGLMQERQKGPRRGQGLQKGRQGNEDGRTHEMKPETPNQEQMNPQ